MQHCRFAGGNYVLRICDMNGYLVSVCIFFFVTGALERDLY